MDAALHEFEPHDHEQHVSWHIDRLRDAGLLSNQKENTMTERPNFEAIRNEARNAARRRTDAAFTDGAHRG